MSDNSPAKAEGGVRYTHRRPGNGRPFELAEGLWWLRLPLPFALDHVNVWLLDDGDGWTVIDTGTTSDECRAIWREVLAGPLLGSKPVARVIATHFHPDHAGMLGELCDLTGAQALMSRTDWLTARSLSLDTSERFLEASEAHDRACGLSEELVQARRARGNLYRKGVSPLPVPFERLQAGDGLTAGGTGWEVRVGRGHAPEMLTFHSAERNTLICADQVLPRISPVVGKWALTPEADPLAEFLDSLEGYRDLPEGTWVLPSHDAPYHGLHARLDKLASHHARRLEQCLEAAAGEPVTAASMMPVLFKRELDERQLGFASSEAMAHLEHLRVKGEMTRTVEQGRWLYRRA